MVIISTRAEEVIIQAVSPLFRVGASAASAGTAPRITQRLKAVRARPAWRIECFSIVPVPLVYRIPQKQKGGAFLPAPPFASGLLTCCKRVRHARRCRGLRVRLLPSRAGRS